MQDASNVRRLAWVPALCVMVLALLWPAFWNGFPIIFADTGGYLARAFDGTLLIGRSAVYGVFLAAGIPLAFWPNITVQAILCIFAILVLLRVCGLGGRPLMATLLVVALGTTTGLPFYVTQLVPDVFTPLAVLSMFLLTFCREDLKRWESAAFGLLIAFAVASHMATLALCLALLAAFALWNAMIRFSTERISGLWPPALAIAAGTAILLVTNVAVAGKLAFTPGGTSFVFGRLIQDGIIARYLADRCPDDSIRLCAYRSQLPDSADGWLWSWGTPLYSLGGPEGYEDEQQRIIGETLTLYPGEHLRTALRSTLHQLALMRTTTSLNAADNTHALETMARLVPDLMPSIEAARQQREGALDLSRFNVVHVPVAIAGILSLALVILLGARRQLPARAYALALTVVLMVAANAAICGILSNPVDRYQSRLIWLAPLTLAVALLNVRSRVTRSAVPAH